MVEQENNDNTINKSNDKSLKEKATTFFKKKNEISNSNETQETEVIEKPLSLPDITPQNEQEIKEKLITALKESNKNVDDKRYEQILKELKSYKKIDIEQIKKLDSGKDVAQKKGITNLRKIYPYWVYIIKDGERIKDFGVREESINGVKLLIRTEKIGDEIKVIFRELYPESRYDANVVASNKKRLSQELNLLKQIERELESELFDKGELSEYNYELSDVKLAILEKEVQLNSIQYGKTFRYMHKWVRDDGIPALVYEFENNGLRLKKEVKEASLFTEASEVKQIESLETKRDIDESLKKDGSRDWKKIAYAFLWAFLFIAGTYAVVELLNYNQERANGDLISQVQRMEVSCSNTYTRIADSLVNTNKPYLDALKENNDLNRNIIESCINNELIEGSKPTIGR